MRRRGALGERDRVTTVIGREAAFQGKLTGSGSLRIEGRLTGEIDFSGDVYVGSAARVEADIRARNLSIAGEVRGNVQAAGRLELAQSARLYGDMQTKILTITEGALFQGTCAMGGEKAQGAGSAASDTA